MNLAVISGSRADYGPLEWVIKTLEADSFFRGQLVKIWNHSFQDAFSVVWEALKTERPDMMLVLGDRFEILAAAIAAHLQRVPIAHIGGGDVTEGSYDDAMRDCISRMASVNFVASLAAFGRLDARGYSAVHPVGSPGVDYILHGDWKGERPIAEPYIVVSYQAETIDGTYDIAAVNAAIGDRRAVWITPNLDAGNLPTSDMKTYEHAEFLNLIYHCEEFIGNSSAMLYEAPFFDPPVKCQMIGKRQKGRVVPWGDGKASERIRDILKAHG